MRKKYFTMNISGDMYATMLAYHHGGEYERRIASKTTTGPTEQDWQKYHEGVRMLAMLHNNKYFTDGGPGEGATMNKPEPTTHYEYAETTQEWIARVLALETEGTP